jgi:hypothetical protein
MSDLETVEFDAALTDLAEDRYHRELEYLLEMILALSDETGSKEDVKLALADLMELRENKILNFESPSRSLLELALNIQERRLKQRLQQAGAGLSRGRQLKADASSVREEIREMAQELWRFDPNRPLEDVSAEIRTDMIESWEAEAMKAGSPVSWKEVESDIKSGRIRYKEEYKHVAAAKPLSIKRIRDLIRDLNPNYTPRNK